MDVRNSIDGSLQISNEVVAKIAKLAALEIDGVADVSSGSMQSVRGLLSKASLQKPVTVDLSDGVAVVQVHVIAKYGSKIMPVCAKVQENVKQTIQNMTGITVSRVDVIVAGLEEPAATGTRQVITNFLRSTRVFIMITGSSLPFLYLPLPLLFLRLFPQPSTRMIRSRCC